MSKRLNDALNFAARCHEGQMRKTGKIPYIIHPMEVASIIAGITENEDTIIAGLLHDILEDTRATEADLIAQFGEYVVSLVKSETENKRKDVPAELTWKIRKEESLEVLKNTDDDNIRILWLADKLANIRSFYRLWLERGDAAFDVFHQKDKKMHEWYYRTVAEYTAVLNKNAAYMEYVQLLNKLFA